MIISHLLSPKYSYMEPHQCQKFEISTYITPKAMPTLCNEPTGMADTGCPSATGPSFVAEIFRRHVYATATAGSLGAWRGWSSAECFEVEWAQLASDPQVNTTGWPINNIIDHTFRGWSDSCQTLAFSRCDKPTFPRNHEVKQ